MNIRSSNEKEREIIITDKFFRDLEYYLLPDEQFSSKFNSGRILILYTYDGKRLIFKKEEPDEFL